MFNLKQREKKRARSTSPGQSFSTSKKNSSVAKLKRDSKSSFLEEKTPRTNRTKKYTSDDIYKLLKGYTLVPRAQWQDIPVHSHVRYIKNDGKFARGGFVISHWFDKNKNPMTQLANGFNSGKKGYHTWPVAHLSVREIHKKDDGRAFTKGDADIKQELNVIKEHANKMIDTINNNNARIKDLEKKVTILINLHKKDSRARSR